MSGEMYSPEPEFIPQVPQEGLTSDASADDLQALFDMPSAPADAAEYMPAVHPAVPTEGHTTSVTEADPYAGLTTAELAALMDARPAYTGDAADEQTLTPAKSTSNSKPQADLTGPDVDELNAWYEEDLDDNQLAEAEAQDVAGAIGTAEAFQRYHAADSPEAFMIWAATQATWRQRLELQQLLAEAAQRAKEEHDDNKKSKPTKQEERSARELILS